MIGCASSLDACYRFTRRLRGNPETLDRYRYRNKDEVPVILVNMTAQRTGSGPPLLTNSATCACISQNITDDAGAEGKCVCR